MSQPASVLINQVVPYQPACSKCGARTMLRGIEPSEHKGHDLRTFECLSCGNIDVVTIRFG